MPAQHAKSTAESSADVSSLRPTSQAAAYAEELTRKYGVDNAVVTAPDHVDISFTAGEFTAIMGPSGSGGSTLMHYMASLDSATSGGAYIGTTELSKLSDREITALRRNRLGLAFQSFNLVPALATVENITLPINIANRKVDKQWFGEITTRLGLKERLMHRPSELSGGQRQHVACTRAIVSRPEVIFDGEPIDNLDSNSSREVLTIFRDAINDTDQIVVIMTYGVTAASCTNRVVFLTDGRMIDELRNLTFADILAYMADIENLQEGRSFLPMTSSSSTLGRVACRNITSHKLRLVFTIISVVLGMAFIIDASVFTSSLDRTFEGAMNTAYDGVDVVVIAPANSLGALTPVIEREAEDFPGVCALNIGNPSNSVTTIGSGGKSIQTNGSLSMGLPYYPSAEAMGDKATVTDGHTPEAPGEMVINSVIAEYGNPDVGTEIKVATRLERTTVKVVGTADTSIDETGYFAVSFIQG